MSLSRYWIPAVAAMTMLLAACGFHLRGETELGFQKLYLSQGKPSLVFAEIKKILAAGPTKIMPSAAEAEAELRIISESREKTVHSLTGAGIVYDFELKLTVHYQLTVPGREDPLIAPTEVAARRLITFSASAPTAKEAEEQLLYKDMQQDIARRILRQVTVKKRELS
jgi:LPS-assembly lipoprotein